MAGQTTSMRSASAEQLLFAEALQLADPQARAAYLAKACKNDAALLRRVERLLSASAKAGDFLEQPPTGFKIDSDSSALEFSEGPGERIDRYKLLEKIGEGGCGSVYMAEQEDPVRRRVALKVIKLGMDTRTVVARFEAERQALALMDHPNIAQVFDGGATRTGRPYFVMELVRGVPLTTFCEQENLTTVERLRLFVLVCQAVQHAHQKGIIHRDLKPSNILVTVNDGAPVPKVIDFGIAKATGQRLTDKTLFTQFHLFIGTPASSAPSRRK
jgi:serine/threonine protein kinase